MKDNIGRRGLISREEQLRNEQEQPMSLAARSVVEEGRVPGSVEGTRAGTVSLSAVTA